MAGRVNSGAFDREQVSDDEHLAEVVPLVVPGGHHPAPASHPPAFVSTFIGRRRELDEVARLLGSARLVTLTGPGGIGKTRLAVEVAGQVAAGRTSFVDLTPLPDGAQVGERIALAFGLGELRGRGLAGVLRAELADDALLLLDNCEHVLISCGDVARELLVTCPGLQILATSQRRLGVGGEVVWSVPPLELPPTRRCLSTDEALHAAAVQLFCDRAGAIKSDFDSSAANVGAIVEICRRLDANPLAIELAAARVEALTPVEIAARLEGRFELLRHDTPTGEARHRTLAAALDWSHDLLSERERVLLRRLSVFAGGFGLPAAEQVCVDGSVVDHHAVLGLLSALVARSLVVADTSGVAARYRLLETVRHYAADALSAADETAGVAERHAAWCVRLAEEAAQAEDCAAGLQALEAERDNVRAALEWCVTHQRAELTLRLACAQMASWEATGRFAEARQWLGRALAAGEATPASLRARGLYNTGFAALVLGELDVARRDVQASLALSLEAGDPASVTERTEGLLSMVSTFGDGPQSIGDLERQLDEARAGRDPHLGERLIGCGHLRLFRGEPVAARRHFEELVVVARQNGDEAMAATALVGLGVAAIGQGECATATEYLQQGASLATATAQLHTQALARMWLAELTRLTGDSDRARAGFEACLGQVRPMGAPYSLARTLLGLGLVLLDQGDMEAARGQLQECLTVAGPASLGHVEAGALAGLGEVALAGSDGAAAQILFDQALAVAEKCGDQTSAALATHQLAELARARGDLDQAVTLHHDALRRRHEIGDRPGVAASLDALAGLFVARDSLDSAARLFGAAEALRRAGGWARRPRQEETHAGDVAALRERTPPEELESAWTEGAALGCDDAVAYATRGRGARSRASRGPDSLTPTERDVVALVVEDLENAEIAERLFMSPRTVQSHLRRVYPKLGVTSRRELRKALGGWRTPG